MKAEKLNTKSSNIRNRDWTVKEEEILRREYINLSDRAIGGLLKRSKDSVRHKRIQMGLILSENVAIRKKRDSILATHRRMEEKKVKKFHLKGYSIYSIAYLANANKISKTKIRLRKKPLESIIEEICEIFEMDIRVKNKKRPHEITILRQMYCFVAKRMYPLKSLKLIGSHVGYKEHTIVIYNIRLIENSLQTKDSLFMPIWNKYLQHTEIFKK